MTHLSRGLRAALLLAALLHSAVAAGVAADEIRDLEARLEMMYNSKSFDNSAAVEQAEERLSQLYNLDNEEEEMRQFGGLLSGLSSIGSSILGTATKAIGQVGSQVASELLGQAAGAVKSILSPGAPGAPAPEAPPVVVVPVKRPKRPIKKRPIKKRPIKKRPIKKRPIKKQPIKKRPIKKRPMKKRPSKKGPPAEEE